MTAPLIEQLEFPRVTPQNLPQWIADHPLLALFFPGDSERYPESLDVAVVLPELVQAFEGAFQPLVVPSEHEKDLRDRYPFAIWPSLVFLRRGVQVATLSRMQDWSDYLEQIGEIVSKGITPVNTISSLQV